MLASPVRPSAVVLIAILSGTACQRTGSPSPGPAPFPPPSATAPAINVVPAPSMVAFSVGTLVMGSRMRVAIDANASPEVEAIGNYAADLIASRAGARAQRLRPAESAPDSTISLALDAGRTDLGDEGYALTVTPAGARIVAMQAAGLFHGVQTLRQLLPAAVEHKAGVSRNLSLPAVRIVDTPRFAWRGAMLDVARHFLGHEDVKHFIDVMALYKLNRLHLHLADDQGWRIEIKSWPRLTTIGSQSAVGGGAGGYYTQQQYADLVAYAKARYITVVPEIDMPGHITAALLSYPELGCSRLAPAAYDAVGGPPNNLCTDRDSVYTFVGDVVHEISMAAPTPYFHIGGDEVQKLTKEQYRGFIERVESIVTAQGPRMIGWGEISPANIHPATIVQHWNPDSTVMHVARGGQAILSPGPRAYLDMKYDSATVLGLRWAGLIDLKTAYDWDPASFIPGVGESSILGVEGPLWAETLITRQDYEYLAFPRLAALSEVGWSRRDRISWDDFRRRIAAHGARLAAMGVNFARVPGITWTW